VQWDSAITLAYAAEQLFAASQLLTSDLVPDKRALRTAYDRHIVPLLENERFLPEGIRKKLVGAHEAFLSANCTGLSHDCARQLASDLMNILRDVSATLNRASGPPSWKIPEEGVA
jgi:hypothetical protein